MKRSDHGMRSRKLMIGMVLVSLCLALGYVVSTARAPADILVVQATTATLAPSRALARLMLGRYESCPEEDFQPSTPFSFVVAGWDAAHNEAESRAILDVFIAIGCSVDNYGGNGLTPLHSAVLFNNARAADSLLQLNANRNLPSRIGIHQGVAPINLTPSEFATYLDEISDENRHELRELLAGSP